MSVDKQQTAVEWLVEEFDLKMQDNFFMTKIQQAKEMDREQKIDMLHSIIHDAQMGEDVEDVEAWFKKYENKSNENSNN
jgi:hypothetical protein